MAEFTDLTESSSAELEYAALIGDVASSRELEDRADFQARLQEELERLNGYYSARRRSTLVGPLTLMKGDEIQALLGPPGPILEVIRHLRDSLYPTRIDWGVGFGTVSTFGPDAKSPLQMDGPSFHLAREALDEARHRGLWVRAKGFGKPYDDLVTAMFDLLDSVRGRWTERQHEVVLELRGNIVDGMGGTTQKSVAATLGVNPSAVSESLKAASFRTVHRAEEALVDLLLELTSGTESEANSPSGPKS